MGNSSYECHMIFSTDHLLRCKHYLNRLCLLLAFLFCVSSSFGQTPVASFSVPNTQGCVPFNVQFTNTSSNASSYQWNFGNGNTSVVANPGNVFTTAGTYTVTLTAISASGQSSTTSTQIIVHQKPVANFSVSQNTGCQGVQVFDFQNQSILFDSCVWDFGDGTTSNLFNPQHVYNISGTFNVTLVVYSIQYGCSDIKVKNAYVTVFPSPTATFTVNDSISCDPQFSFQFSAQMQNAISWSWNFGDGSTSTQTNPSHVYPDTGRYFPTLTMTSSNGCSQTVAMPTSMHVKWNPIPQISISDDSGCMPHYVALVATHYNNASYNWSLGNGLTRTSSAVYYTYPDSGSYPLAITVTYDNGCQRNLSPGVITVLPRPFFTYSMVNFQGCAPLPVQFVNNTNANYTWLWDFGDGNTSTLQAPIHLYTTTGTYQVSLEATTVNGCKLGYPLGQKVNVFAPIANFSADLISGCPPLLVNFSNLSVGATSWTWDFGDGTTSTQQHPSHTYSNVGSYQVRLIAADNTGCVDTFLLPSLINVATATVNYVTPPPITGCAPYAVNFSDASGAASFLWNFGDGTTSTAANPYHVYNSPGTFTVSLTYWMPNGGCEQYIQNFQTFIIDGAYPGFTYTVSPCPPYEVFFTDTSLNASSWQWSFGDGGSSSMQNPSHIYPGPGIYSVKLICTTPGGCNTTLTATNSVVINGLGAHGTSFTTDTVAPASVQFNANSTNATWWLWTFGDGDSSSLENPLHVYQSLGPFTITLTIGNDSCQYTYVYPPISFGPNTGSGGGLGGGVPPTPPRVYHCAPFTVSFTNPDPSAINILWVFGDGTTSTLNNPSHSYSDSGAFVTTVYLYYAGGAVDSLQFTDTAFVVKPISDFTISQTNLCNGVIIDVQTNAPGNYFKWDFGSGNIFSTPTATYTYPNVNASYMISLNVKDTNDCPSFVAKSFSINVTNPITSTTRRACAGDSISFNPGNVNYAQYLWDFGDGTTSTLSSPSHAYLDSGLFQVSLSVIDINGCSLTFNLAYIIEVFNPIAGFTFNPPITNCTSLYVEFINTSTGSNSYFWTFGTFGISTQLNPVYNFTTYGNQDVMLIASKNICRDTLIINNAFYVSDLIPDFSYITSTNCAPANISFTDLSVDAVSWHWDFGDGDTSNLQNPTHVYLKNPADSITLTVRDINGCVKSISKKQPEITVASIAVNNLSGCIPFIGNFSDTSVNSVAWLWNFGDGTTSNLQNPSHSYLTDGFYNVSLTVTSSSGCTSSLSLDSLIEINSPVANFSVNNDSGCAPLLINFYDLSVNASVWQWSLGNGNTSGNVQPSLIYATPGIYNVQLTIENKFGCKDSVMMDSAVVVQGPIPQFTVSTVSGCAPMLVSFVNSTTGAVNYDWNFGDGMTDTVFDPSHIYTNPGSFTATLYAVDSLGCSAIYTLPVPIEIGASPFASFSIDVLSGCSPLSVQLDDAGTIADSIVYNMGDGNWISGSSPGYVYSTPGDYVITMIAYNQEGCTDTLVLADTIHVLEQPIASFTIDVTEGCSPVEVSISNTSTGLNNSTFSWDLDDGSTASSFNVSHIYTTPDIYTVTLIVTNANGCSDDTVAFDLIEVYDDIPPPVTKMFLVTVVDPSKVLLNWEQTNVSDLDYYEVFRLNNVTNVFDTIAKVYHSNNGTVVTIPEYVDSLVNTDLQSYSYKVQAFDKCGYGQDLSLLKAHETIYLNAVAGLQQVSLSWSPYGGCPINGYEIYRSDRGGAFALVGMVDSITLNYLDTTTFCPYEYTYKVKALEVCGNALYDSWSNEKSATPTSVISDQFVDVVKSTVVNNLYVLTEWMPPVTLPSAVLRYDIFRSTDQVNYTMIASVPALMLDYSDFNVSINTQEYYYKIIVQNICDVNSKEGLIGSSILLTKLVDSSGNFLKWTQYKNWSTGVDYYVIEKQDEFGVWKEIDRVPGTITDWEEK
jgi:PKD repeat protein